MRIGSSAKFATNVLLICGILTLGLHAFAQDNESAPDEPPYNNSKTADELSMDSEVDAVNGKPTIASPAKPAAPAAPAQKVVKEEPVRKTVVRSNEREVELKQEPQFVKPEGPSRGGILIVPHPNAAKGLSRINKDGSYQYKVRMKPKSKSSAIRMGVLTPPKIVGAKSLTGSTKTFDDFYGSGNIVALNFDYEWQPYTNFGRLGFILGAGFATVRGSGYFEKDGTKAEEVYNLYIFPLSAFADYRFEYKRRQWAIPFVKAGLTYFGLAEVRDDNKSPTLLGSPAIGGGGGVHFSITAFDQQGAFVLDREYGIADMYVTLEAQALKGISSDLDFSTQMVSLGITVDF